MSKQLLALSLNPHGGQTLALWVKIGGARSCIFPTNMTNIRHNSDQNYVCS